MAAPDTVVDFAEKLAAFDELLADAGRVAAEDLLTLRLREWPGG
ncbi:MAG TPA: hypothetical protein VG409_05530 [Actinomycetota bacterium]|nr:hypothetical protein [Actinomycetota bacterium]